MTHTSSSRAIGAALLWLNTLSKEGPQPLSFFRHVTEEEIIEADLEHYDDLGGKVGTAYSFAREAAVNFLRQELRRYGKDSPATLLDACSKAGILGAKLAWSYPAS